MKVETVAVDSLSVDPANVRRHDERNLDAIKGSLRRFGQQKPIVVDAKGIVVAGNGTLEAARALGWEEISVARSELEGVEAVAYAIADNRTAEMAAWDDHALAAALVGLQAEDPSAREAAGFSEEEMRALSDAACAEGDGDGADPAAGAGDLASRFGVPPFSTLDARAGYWATRKRAWIALGLQSEQGRDLDEAQTASVRFLSAPELTIHDFYARRSRGQSREEIIAESGGHKPRASIFDPVLCEVLIRWFSGPGDRVLDPFAGGSVRGIVAAALGRRYVGVDIRAEQVEANERQAAEVFPRLAGGEVQDWPAETQTPIEEHGGFLVKRDDLFSVAGARGGKARACWALAQTAEGGLVTAGSRSSPQANIVAHIASRLGIPCRVHTPEGDLSPELLDAQSCGAEIVQHPAGYNNVIIARAREDAAERGWVEIPFGMECPAAVEQTATQATSLPFGDFERLVVPVGSGMSLAGVLTGLGRVGQHDLPVIGVCVGADPEKRLDDYAPADWRDRVQLEKSELDYHAEAPDSGLGDLLLDPIYEAKAVPFLRPGDLLWVVGIRGVAAPGLITAEAAANIPTPEWVVGDSADVVPSLEGSFDFVLSCPPYADLEVYSDDPADVSTMPYDAFLAAYRGIICASVGALASGRFIGWVVGEVRDRKAGTQRGFVADTVRAFEDAGASLFNEMVLVQPTGAAAMRAAHMMRLGRKPPRTHQSVLVFVKGDWADAHGRLPPPEVPSDDDLADLLGRPATHPERGSAE